MRKFWRKLKFIGKRRQFARDLEEEMRIHIEMLGSRKDFGNSTLLKEMSREVWGFNARCWPHGCPPAVPHAWIP